MHSDEMFCPSCDGQREHAYIKSSRSVLVKCEDCGYVHPADLQRTKLSSVKAIVGRGDVSQSYQINMPSDDILCVGKEILIDDGKSDVVLAVITSLETDKREEEAAAFKVRTIWARAIDETVVKIAVSSRGRTKSFHAKYPGDAVFEIGQIGTIENVKYVITKIKTREDGFEDSAMAKDIVRIWARPFYESSEQRSIHRRRA
jgi:uncharacterized Zn finger protein